MRTVAIIVAGGRGTRIGGPVNKQFLPLLGKPILAHSVERFEACPAIDEIILVAPEDSLGFVAEELVDRFGFTKVRKVVSGGAERQDSVYAGLRAVDGAPDVVAIHDGVRPFVSVALIAELVKQAEASGAVVPGLRPSDTIKRVEEGCTTDTLDRDGLVAVQTPQVFDYALIMRAYEAAIRDGSGPATDDAALVERIGGSVHIVPGEASNIKVTTPHDLMLAEAIMRDLR